MALGDGGPHVQTAVLCEKVLRDANGGLSLISIVEGVAATAFGPDVPDEMPALSLEGLFLVVTLWADKTKGRYELKVRPEAPSGIQEQPLVLPVNFRETGNKGVDTILPMPYTVTEEGVYWFDILFASPTGGEDRLLSRIPLNVMYQPQRLIASSS
jgi:hypothetical protein